MNGYFSIPANLYDRLINEGKGGTSKPERGGILIGQYRGPHIEITDITVPGKSDRASLFRFDRRDAVHQRSAMKAWRTSGNTKTYVGEWHTHPFGAATPSGMDKRTWERLTRETGGPLIFIIATPADIACFRAELGNNGKIPASVRLRRLLPSPDQSTVPE